MTDATHNPPPQESPPATEAPTQKPLRESMNRGERFSVTQRQTELKWGGGFWCKLCGHKFSAGDTARWIFANSTPGSITGNFFVCGGCDADSPTLIERANESKRQAIELAKRWDRG